MSFDAYGDVDMPGLLIFVGSLVAGYAIGGMTNYFMRRPFVSDAVLAVALMVTLAFVVLQFIPRGGSARLMSSLGWIGAWRRPRL